MSLLQGMLLCHTLVKSCSDTIRIARLSELQSDIKVLGSLVFLGAGGRAQILWKSWGVEPICCFSLQADAIQTMNTEAGEKIYLCLQSPQKMGNR